MSLLVTLLASMLSVAVAAYLLPGIEVNSWTTVLLVAIGLGIANAVLKPILILLTLPINLLTLGLFTLVINALLVLLVANFIPGFQVDGFLWALIFSIVVSVVSSVVHSLI